MRKIKQIAKATVGTASLFLLTNSLVFAQEIQQVDILPRGPFAGLSNIRVETIIGGLVTLSLIIAAIVFFFILVIGGIRWILSGGDKAQTEGARNQITAALVGLVIVFSAWAILQLVNTLFGIDILKQLQIPSFNPDPES